jgi:hypothetical protein
MATYQGATTDFINLAVISGNPSNDALQGDRFDCAGAAGCEAIQPV